MQRTPPKGNDSITQYVSEPNLISPKSGLEEDRITFRQKRKHDQLQSADLDSLRDEIMSAIGILSTEQNEKFNMLKSNLDEIKKQNTELLNTVDFLSNKYDDMMEKIALIENEKKSLSNYVKSLEDRIENMERNAKSSCLEIRNVPKINVESKKDLLNIVKTIGTAVNMEVQGYEVRDIYRYNNNNGNPNIGGPITVEFMSTITKDKLLTHIKKYNRDHKTNRLNSSHIKMAGNIPIYISESLTAKAKKLYYQAREFTKQNGFAYHWTSRGKIYIRSKEGAPPKRIEQESDFEKLKQQDQ